MRAVLRSTMLAVSPRPRFVLHGTCGAFFKQTYDPQEINLRRGDIPETGPWGGEPQEDWGVLTTIENDVVTKRSVPSSTSDYRDYYANVRDAILGRAALAVSPEYALDVMRVLELAQESSRKRCTIAW
jgi:predicted dehydrogenase